MSVKETIIGLAACVLVWAFGFWREKKHELGTVSLVPPFYIQFLGIVGFFVFAAHLIAITTGLDWTPPFRR
ncbi:hypothetical protein ACFO5Q_12850 [Kordiimonas lipolytica]|uniref:Uncharacterized protein n=1 Tax=Kordiimonas lipolytica TaxID=1662421 RepID=A0ABV8UCZ4_9PROT|nr:hypothetical protein [Kordiimonas lipolytica]